MVQHLLSELREVGFDPVAMFTPDSQNSPSQPTPASRSSSRQPTAGRSQPSSYPSYPSYPSYQDHRGPFADIEPPVAFPGVACDECLEEIYTRRFKCCVCPNFDLCAACEAAGVHRHHTMLRVCDPAQPNYGLDQSTLFQQRQTPARDGCARFWKMDAAHGAPGQGTGTNSSHVEVGTRADQSQGWSYTTHSFDPYAPASPAEPRTTARPAVPRYTPPATGPARPARPSGLAGRHTGLAGRTGALPRVPASAPPPVPARPAAATSAAGPAQPVHPPVAAHWQWASELDTLRAMGLERTDSQLVQLLIKHGGSVSDVVQEIFS